jgi:hypothetical protein
MAVGVAEMRPWHTMPSAGGQTGAAAVMVAERGAAFLAEWADEAPQPAISVREPVAA